MASALFVEHGRKRVAISAAVGIAVIVVLAAIAGVAYYALTFTPQTGTNSSSSTSGQLTDVTMGFAGVPDVTDTPGFMLWQTFAQQLGLRIHVQYYDGDTTVADAVVAGNVQIG